MEHFIGLTDTFRNHLSVLFSCGEMMRLMRETNVKFVDLDAVTVIPERQSVKCVFTPWYKEMTIPTPDKFRCSNVHLLLLPAGQYYSVMCRPISFSLCGEWFCKTFLAQLQLNWLLSNSSLKSRFQEKQTCFRLFYSSCVKLWGVGEVESCGSPAGHHTVWILVFLLKKLCFPW